MKIYFKHLKRFIKNLEQRWRYVTFGVLLAGIVVTVMLVQNTTDFLSRALSESVQLSFTPSSVNLFPGSSASLKLMLDTKSNKIAFARVHFSINPALIQLSSEIDVSSSPLKMVISKTSMQEVNVSKEAVIVLAQTSGVDSPSGIFEIANFSITPTSSMSDLTTQIIISSIDIQIVSIEGTELTYSSFPADIIVSVSSTPTPTSVVLSSTPTRTPTPTMRPSSTPYPTATPRLTVTPYVTATPRPTSAPTPTGCTYLSSPTNLSPHGVINSGLTPLSWSPVSGASYYSIRINDLSNGWDSRCGGYTKPGDVCEDKVIGNSFSYNFQTGHNYKWWVHARNDCGRWGSSSYALVYIPGSSSSLSSSFVSQTPPKNKIITSSYFSVPIVFRNTGTEVWKRGAGILLWSENPSDNIVWGKQSIPLSGTVYPNGTYTFYVYAKAPQMPGTYNFQWRMRKGTEAFGEYSANLALEVFPPPPLNPKSLTYSHLNGQVTFSWKDTANADHYVLKVNDLTNYWNNNCVSPNQGDFCADVFSNSFTFNCTPTHKYSWWVHAVDKYNRYSYASYGQSFTCP